MAIVLKVSSELDPAKVSETLDELITQSAKKIKPRKADFQEVKEVSVQGAKINLKDNYNIIWDEENSIHNVILNNREYSNDEYIEMIENNPYVVFSPDGVSIIPQSEVEGSPSPESSIYLDDLGEFLDKEVIRCLDTASFVALSSLG